MLPVNNRMSFRFPIGVVGGVGGAGRPAVAAVTPVAAAAVAAAAAAALLSLRCHGLNFAPKELILLLPNDFRQIAKRSSFFSVSPFYHRLRTESKRHLSVRESVQDNCSRHGIRSAFAVLLWQPTNNAHPSCSASQSHVDQDSPIVSAPSSAEFSSVL